MNVQDRRIVRTRKALIDALVELSLERGYENVKIKDIIDHANIGNSTFYRHYKNKNDLLAKHLYGIEQEFKRGTSPEMTPYEVSLSVFTIVDKHRDSCLLAMSLPEDHPVMIPILERATESVDAHYEARDETVIPFKVSANHMVSSFIKMFYWWITEGEDFSPEQMATMASELILKVTATGALDRRAGGLPSAPDFTQ